MFPLLDEVPQSKHGGRTNKQVVIANVFDLIWADSYILSHPPDLVFFSSDQLTGHLS